MSPRSVLVLAGVSRRYGHGATAVTAVRAASLEVGAGEVVGIMGPSGSGKSTLLSIMGGLLAPDTGDVTIAGRSLRHTPPAQLARLRRGRVGFVFQRFNLLKALSARENVELGLRLAGFGAADAAARVADALARLGLTARASALPCDLSGGEQQRVAVARALAPEPSLVLADEPTGSLDAANGRAIIDMVCAHAHQHDAATVIVTHDLRVQAAVDRLLWMGSRSSASRTCRASRSRPKSRRPTSARCGSTSGRW